MDPSKTTTKIVALKLLSWSRKCAELSKYEDFERQYADLVGKVGEYLHLHYSQQGDLNPR
jgi:hypothetical protein